MVILVPRLNLAIQIELSWKANRKHFEPNALGPINHRENKWPVMRKGEAGYVTTYQSLIANPELHLDALKNKRILLALDEAQQLGADYAGEQVVSGTASAEQVQRLVDALDVVGIMVLSGTPFRADDSRLLFAKYETRDGLDYLLPDVTATYSDGIEGGYLRQFEANLYDGEVDWKTTDQELEKLTLSQYDRSLRTFLVESAGYWHGLVDRFVEHLAERQAVDRRFRGLIACYNQEQATHVMDYLAAHHPHLRTLKAISDDGEDAQENLRLFRSEKHQYDVLVTVQMAYVGYDQPWIAVVLPLTGIREQGYLRQLLARSLRVVPGVPYAKQPAIWVVPADPRMKAFIEAERKELEVGLRRRERNQEGNTDMIQLSRQADGWGVDGRVTERSAMGFYKEGDAKPDEIPLLERLIAELNLGTPVSSAKALLVKYEMAHQQSFQRNEEFERTQREREKDALDHLQSLISDVIHRVQFFRSACISEADWGRAHQAIRAHLKLAFRKAVTALDLDEIQAEIETVQHWLRNNEIPDGVQNQFRRLQ